MKTIITLGSRLSGSSAVFDYLNGREDIIDPLMGEELLIIQSPYGILSFLSTAYEAFHPLIASEALDKLEWFLDKAGYRTREFKCGYNMKQNIPHYHEKVKRYIRSITSINYYHKNAYAVFMKHSWWKCVAIDIAGRLFTTKFKAQPQRLPVSKDLYLTATRDFTTSLFEECVSEYPNAIGLIIHQAGSYFCPEKSLEIFKNAYIIVISRDPRDQFIEWKQSNVLGMKPDVNTYIQWYKIAMSYDDIKNKDDNNPRIKRIRFEDFVLNHEYEKEQLCCFLGLDPNIQSNYDPKKSAKNIGKYKRGSHEGLLTENEKMIIESELPQYLFNN